MDNGKVQPSSEFRVQTESLNAISGTSDNCVCLFGLEENLRPGATTVEKGSLAFLTRGQLLMRLMLLRSQSMIVR